MAAHKLNVFHFHLTDDQGWRVEIERYPRLTEVGSWRARTKFGHRASPLWEEKPHGGFYTQDDIREIVAYAAERHITVVPEIDVPGHSQAAIAAYPELGNTDVIDTTSLSVWDTWGINKTYSPPLTTPCASSRASSRKSSGCSGGVHSRRRRRVREGPVEAVVHRAGPHRGTRGRRRGRAPVVVHRALRQVARRTRRRLIGWDEILEGGLAPGAAVSSWRGYAGGITAARAGHDVVMCPEQQVYLDHRQHDGADEPVPIGYVRTLEDVFRFEPVPRSWAPRRRGTSSVRRPTCGPR